MGEVVDLTKEGTSSVESLLEANRRVFQKYQSEVNDALPPVTLSFRPRVLPASLVSFGAVPPPFRPFNPYHQHTSLLTVPAGSSALPPSKGGVPAEILEPCPRASTAATDCLVDGPSRSSAFSPSVSNSNPQVPPGYVYSAFPSFSRPVATLSLTTHSEFIVRIESGQVTNALLVDVQSVPGSRFDLIKQRFVFPLESHEGLVALLTHAHGFIVEPVPRNALAAATLHRSRCKANKESCPAMMKTDTGVESLANRLSSRLLAGLAPFQREAVAFVMHPDRSGRALVADEMGLGKTRTAIACAMIYHQDWPVLIMCPSSAKHHWLQELLALACPEHLSPSQITIVDDHRHPVLVPGRWSNDCARLESQARGIHSPPNAYQVVIVSYALVTRVLDRLAALRPGVVICDECHFLKNAKAKRTRATAGLVAEAARVIMLSGTPALSRPAELFTTLHMLRPGEWTSESDFHARYCAGAAKGVIGVTGNGFTGAADRGATHTRELYLVLSSSLMLRRLKRDVLSSLPVKRRSVIALDLGDDSELVKKMAALLDRLLDSEDSSLQLRTRGTHPRESTYCDGTKTKSFEVEFSKAIPVSPRCDVNHDVGFLSSNYDQAANDQSRDLDQCRGLSMLTQLFCLTGRVKAEAILHHIADHLAHPIRGKLVVFAHHKAVLERLAQFLNGHPQRVQFIQIDGRVEASQRTTAVHDFQTNPEVRVALLSITAAGVALTLTAASTVFFAELYWTPGLLLQAEDRVHRIGQTREVHVTYFLAEGSADVLLWPLLRAKMRVLGEVVEGLEGKESEAWQWTQVGASSVKRKSMSDTKSHTCAGLGGAGAEKCDKSDEDPSLLTKLQALALQAAESENKEDIRGFIEEDDKREICVDYDLGSRDYDLVEGPDVLATTYLAMLAESDRQLHRAQRRRIEGQTLLGLMGEVVK